MGKMSRRKFEKRKARERDIRRRKAGGPLRRPAVGQYPEWLLRLDAVPPRLGEMVRAAVGRIDFDDAAYFTDDHRKRLRDGAVDGFAGWHRALHQSGDAMSAEIDLALHVGSVLYGFMPQGDLEELLFDNDVRVLPDCGKLLVTSHTLRRTIGPWGAIYHSPYRPRIAIGGEDLVVGFSRHAIERIYDRVVPAWRTYAGHGDAFAFVHNCVYFEPCMLDGQQLGFTLYEECRKGFWSREYVRQVLGEPAYESDERYGFRVGYCPVALHDGFAVAKTLLFPGYRATREHQRLQCVGEPQERREELRRKARELSAWQLQSTMDFDPVRWFHQNGVPQVIRLEPDRVLFRMYEDEHLGVEPELWVLAGVIGSGAGGRYVEANHGRGRGPLVFCTFQSAEAYRRQMTRHSDPAMAKMFRQSMPRRKTQAQLRELSSREGLGWRTAYLFQFQEGGPRGTMMCVAVPLDGDGEVRPSAIASPVTAGHPSPTTPK